MLIGMRPKFLRFPDGSDPEVALNVTSATDGTLNVFQGSSGDVNSLAEPNRVAPVRSRIDGLGVAFRRTVPAHSVSVFEIATVRPKC